MTSIRCVAAIIAALGLAYCQSPGGQDAATDSNHGDMIIVDAADTAVRCLSDNDCSDHVFCNGLERCMPGAAGADARGCLVASPTSPCQPGDMCDEATSRCTSPCADADHDGHRARSCGGDDCDDADPARFPGNHEVCDAAHDEDCDFCTVGSPPSGTAASDGDLDSDMFVSTTCANAYAGAAPTCDARQALVDTAHQSVTGTDCNDRNRSVHPTATEACNGVDDNCNGMIDDGAVIDLFVDADGDGHGDPGSPRRACADTAGLVPVGDDCDDHDPARYPGLAEFCDSKDNDCNTLVDDGTHPVAWYPDADGDGFGAVTGAAVMSCSPVPGNALRNTDCNDSSAATHPGAAETCDGVDNNCSGTVDEGVSIDGFVDADQDGFGDPARAAHGCPGPTLARLGTDCDDTNPGKNPGQAEACDGIDNNCSGASDEGAIAVPWYPDADGDGFGARAGTPVSSCAPVAGHVLVATDCDDVAASVHPGAAEQCDGIDNDCNGIADYAISAGNSEDDDLDGFVDGLCTPRGNDCDDTNPLVHPGVTEICNGLDDNCNGSVDEGVAGSLYRDADGDSVGSAASGTLTGCVAVAGYSRLDGDCNDADTTIHPGAAEACNGIDDNCNGSIDDGAPRVLACSERSATCGGLSDECSGVLECGACASGQTCGGGGSAHACGCTPRTCAQLGASCGSALDGCGGTLACGTTCPTGTTCGGGGAPNVCGASLCSTDGWCVRDPLPVPNDIVSLWASSPEDTWALANYTHGAMAGAIVLRRVNGAWTISTYLDGEVSNAIWGSSASDVWVAGDNGSMAHWNGSAWTIVPAGTTANLRSLWGTSANNVWAVGDTITHWDGSAWTDAIGGGVSLNDVWGSSADHVWAVGAAGNVYRFDGSAWAPETLPPSAIGNFTAVWGNSGTDVWVFGSSASDVLRYNGTAWTSYLCGPGCPTRRVRDAGGNGIDIFAVGDYGSVARWNGTVWTTETVPVRTTTSGVAYGDLSTVWSIGSAVWIGGTAGTLARRTGNAWEGTLGGAAETFTDVWASPDGGDAWSVGNGGYSGPYIRLHRIGGRWYREDVANNLAGVWGSAWNDVWAVGTDPSGNAVTEHYDGAAWSRVTTGASIAGTLEDVWGTGPSDAWAVGSGMLLHWDGIHWTRSASIGGHSVWGAAANDVWVINEGATNTLYHFDGRTWSPTALSAPLLPDNFRGTAVWGSGTSNVFAVGYVGAGEAGLPVAFRWNGTAWSNIDLSTLGLGMTSRLTGVWGSSASDVYVTASSLGSLAPVPTLLHFNGTAWTAAMHAAILEGIWGSGPGDILVSGREGLARFDGTRWAMDPRTADAAPLHALWASGPDDAWAAGEDRIMRRDASGWYEPPLPSVRMNIRSIWGSGASNVWFADPGSSMMLRWNGSGFVAVTVPLNVYDLHGTAVNNVWAVGSGAGGVARYNGLAWSSLSVTGASTPHRAVWVVSSTNVWLADAGNSIYSYDGTTWTRRTTGSGNEHIADLWGTGPNDLWAVGDTMRVHPTFGNIPTGYVMHWNGTAWTNVAPSTVIFDFVRLHGIWGRSASDVFVAGDYGAIYHWDGTAWAGIGSVSVSDFESIAGTSTRMWAAGGSRGAIEEHTF